MAGVQWSHPALVSLKHIDVKHLFKFKWKLKVHTFVVQSKPECARLIHDEMNMWLLRITKIDLLSCEIPEQQCLCLCHDSTA